MRGVPRSLTSHFPGRTAGLERRGPVTKKEIGPINFQRSSGNEFSGRGQ